MSGLGAIGPRLSESETLLDKLMCAPDLKRDLTWNEIDGVRRIIEIIFTSLILNAETGKTISLTRTFTYQAADPFDLVTIIDSIGIV